jgi:hypothetical protein
MSINEPVDLDAIGQAATALAERNDDVDAVKLAADRITTVIQASSTAALTDIGKQIEALRALYRVIERRRDGLIEAAIEHVRFSQDTMKSTAIMADAVDGLNKQFTNGLPPSLRLVPSEGER